MKKPVENITELRTRSKVKALRIYFFKININKASFNKANFDQCSDL